MISLKRNLHHTKKLSLYVTYTMTVFRYLSNKLILSFYIAFIPTACFFSHDKTSRIPTFCQLFKYTFFIKSISFHQRHRTGEAKLYQSKRIRAQFLQRIGWCRLPARCRPDRAPVPVPR